MYMRMLGGMVAAVLFMGGLSPAAWGQETGQAPESKGVRIGVYDPRAIAIAWARSEHNPVDDKQKEYTAAKKNGDKRKMAELEAWGPAQQRLLHFQGFGHVPVSDLLQPVRESLTQVLRTKQLAAIAMECDAVAENAETVDVTLDLVQLFEPTEETLALVEQLRDKRPLSLLELADMGADE